MRTSRILRREPKESRPLRKTDRVKNGIKSPRISMEWHKQDQSSWHFDNVFEDVSLLLSQYGVALTERPNPSVPWWLA